MTNNTKWPAGQANDVIVALSERFPACFHVFEQLRRPLKIGIHDDIIAEISGAIADKEIRIALRIYTGNTGYLCACIEGAPRVDLDGEPAGIVTAAEAEHARELLARRKTNKPTTGDSSPVAKPGNTKRRIGLADLKAAAVARRAGAAS